jgi:hypothetical protein
MRNGTGKGASIRGNKSSNRIKLRPNTMQRSNFGEAVGEETRRESRIKGIIFSMENRIKIIIRSIYIYIEITGNQKCKGGRPNLIMSLIIII